MLVIRSQPSIEYAVIDVETTDLADGERPATKFWGFADRHGYKDFKTSAQLAAFLRKQKPYVLLHHSNFDAIQLMLDGILDGFGVEKSHDGKLIRSFYFQHTLQNTLAAFPVSLESIFNAFGYKKTPLSDLRKRNYEDCVVALECFLKLDAIFQDLIGVSALRTGTVAGTTFKAAERTAGTMPKDLRFLDAYRGGRVEVFDTRETFAYNYDVNSSYPASFMEVQPNETLLYAEVKTKDWLCPMFDAGTDEMLLFPNGKFKTWIFESNLKRYILPNCEKTSVRVLNSWHIDCNWLLQLQELIATLYKMKCETKSDGIKTACKFLLNAFYGRIGLKGESERVRLLDAIPDDVDCMAYQIGKKKWLVFDTVERETRANYGFAAFITDNARARLFEAFAKNVPLYGDTDSVFTTSKRFHGSHGAALGQFSFKKSGTFKARNVKDYTFRNKVVRKGGKRSIVWTLHQFASGKPARIIERERRTGLRKRVVLPNGETQPVQVG